MKRSILALVLALLAFPLPAATLAERLGYPADSKLLIVHADDLGMAHTVNAASTAALGTGLVNSASIMVPCPWFAEIVTYARKNPDADLGLHLTLTSEWTSLRWGPVLPENRVASLLDTDGYLHLTESEASKRMDPREAEAEIRAQVARARAAGIKPTHLDSHMGTLYQTKALFEALMRVAREEKLPARISRAHARQPHIAASLTPDDIVIDHIISIGPDVKDEQWADWYTAELERLQPGVAEVILHLAHDDAEMRAIAVDHPAWGSAWRQRDFDFFTSDRFRKALHDNNIRLITWRQLAALLQK